VWVLRQWSPLTQAETSDSMDLLGISCACPFIYNCCFGFSVRFVMFRVFRGSPLIQIVSPLAVSSRLPIHSQCFVCFAFFQHETSRSTKQGVIAGLTAVTTGALVGLIVGLDNCPLSANRSFLHIDDPCNSDSASCGSESDEHARSRRSESNKTTRAVVSLFGLLMTQKEQSETRMAKASTLVAHDATSSQILCARVSRSMVVPTTNVRAAIAIG